MAKNFPGLAIHDPIRKEEETSGKDSKFIFFNFSKFSKFSVEELKSSRCFDKSRIFPVLSKAAGFSLPAFPTLNSFIFDLFFQFLCKVNYDLRFRNRFLLSCYTCLSLTSR